MKVTTGKRSVFSRCLLQALCALHNSLLTAFSTEKATAESIPPSPRLRGTGSQAFFFVLNDRTGHLRAKKNAFLDTDKTLNAYSALDELLSGREKLPQLLKDTLCYEITPL